MSRPTGWDKIRHFQSKIADTQYCPKLHTILSKHTPHNTAQTQYFPNTPIKASAKIDASANTSNYTKINCNSSQTARSASDTLKVAPTNEADKSLDPGVSPQTMNLVQKAESAKYVACVPMDGSSTLSPLLTPLCNGSQDVSMRGWSGALPKESQ